MCFWGAGVARAGYGGPRVWARRKAGAHPAGGRVGRVRRRKIWDGYMISRTALLIGLGLFAAASPAMAQTLNDSLAAAYANNPTLQAERANLRAVDENVPQALAGWRPTITVGGSVGYVQGNQTVGGSSLTGLSGSQDVTTSQNRDLDTVQAQITENVYNGGKTKAQTAQAKNKVRAERANLINIEQQVFT